MEANITEYSDQLTLKKQLLYHFYPGILIALGYIILSDVFVANGYPGMAALLAVELLILAPIAILHLGFVGKSRSGSFSIRSAIRYTEKLSFRQYAFWTILGVVGCLLIYVPLYPVGLYLKETVFNWLPEWYFNPAYGASGPEVVANIFLVAIVIDGIVGPVAEELFFRGYLLPRMAYLKGWAPVLNGLLFGLYHFWQPHNYFAIIAVGIILSYIVWRKKNVYLGILIHCIINILGAIGGYMAASSGEMILR